MDLNRALNVLLYFINVNFLQMVLSQGSCPPRWVNIGQRCYRALVYSTPAQNRTWSFARHMCLTNGGDLVSITDTSEQLYVDLVRKGSGIADGRFYWIGLTDQAMEGAFRWTDGSAPGYFNWYQDEPTSDNPTNSFADSHDFVVACGGKKWSDVTNDWSAMMNGKMEPAGFICERGASLPPGAPGKDGKQGKAGPQGRTGPTGMQGPTGNTGSSGFKGPPGEKGEPGAKGSAGNPGRRGTAGQTGLPGKTGKDGPRGVQGLQGIPGQTGKRGPRGRTGLQGVPGVPGRKGAVGMTGRPGHTGRPGTPGQKGVPGVDGRPGVPGRKGEPGMKDQPGKEGPTGRPGAVGRAGAGGSPGLPGTPGKPGTTGSTGYPGSKGATGSPGRKGVPGEPGKHGAKGEKGSRGATGFQGRQGVPGVPGDKGTAGDKGERGELGAKGTKGEKGAVGMEGPQGRPGNSGPDGQMGSKGFKGEGGDKGPLGGPGSSGPSGMEGPTGLRGMMGEMGPPGPPGPLSRAGTSTLTRRDETKRAPSSFVNATAYCSFRLPGVYPHPLHCWQFLTCGAMYGGDHENCCYAGRRYAANKNECVKDASCVFGAPNMKNKRAWALRYKDPRQVKVASTIKRTLNIYAVALTVVILMICGLGIIVVKYHARTSQPRARPFPGDSISYISEI